MVRAVIRARSDAVKARMSMKCAFRAEGLMAEHHRPARERAGPSGPDAPGGETRHADQHMALGRIGRSARWRSWTTSVSAYCMRTTPWSTTASATEEVTPMAAPTPGVVAARHGIHDAESRYAAAALHDPATSGSVIST
jgi:hypothetical protein